MKLEMIEDIEIAHPFIKGYDNKFICKTEQEKEMAQLGKLQPQIEDSVQEQVNEFTVQESVEPKQEPETEQSTQEEVKNEQEDQDTLQENESKDKIEEFPVLTTCLYIGISVKTKEKGKNRKLDLSWPVMEFKKLVTSWDKYDETSMGIHVEFLKR